MIMQNGTKGIITRERVTWPETSAEALAPALARRKRRVLRFCGSEGPGFRRRLLSSWRFYTPASVCLAAVRISMLFPVCALL
jgi:hypothetical protein